MRHTRDLKELLEVLGGKLRSVVGNDPRFNPGVPRFGPFQNDLDIGLRHMLAQILMDQETTVAVQRAAQRVERTANFDLGNIDMPMLVWPRRLFKAGLPFFEGFRHQFPSGPARLITRDTLAGLTATMLASSIMNVSRRQPSSRFFSWNAMIARFSQSSSQKSPGNSAVMLIDLALPFAPVVELAGRDVDPPNEPPGADLGLLGPAPDEIYDLVSCVVRNSDSGQTSPTLF